MTSSANRVPSTVVDDMCFDAGEPAGPRRWPRRIPTRGLLRLLLAVVLVLVGSVAGPAVQAEEGVHIVQRGESLTAIARSYNVDVRELAASNGIANFNIIHAGQRLVIPGSLAAANRAVDLASALPAGDGYYTVQRGDSLARVAQNFGVSLGDVMRLNGLTNPNFIWVGQKLRVSARVDAIQAEKQAEPAVADAIHVVQDGDTLAQIAKDYNTTTYELMADNGLPNPEFLWAGQRLRVKSRVSSSTMLAANAPADGVRWIEVNLSNQTLTAWQGNVAVLHTNVSTGTWRTPTVTGRFAIGLKYPSQHMSGPGYSLPGVPWVMYFFQGYAIHGTYWHANYGTPMSHGCVNMRTGEAQFLYNWAPVGTEVYVHY